MNELGNTPADKNYKPSGISRAEEAARKKSAKAEQKANERWPIHPWTILPKEGKHGEITNFDEWLDDFRIWVQSFSANRGYKEGYEQAEKDLAHLIESAAIVYEAWNGGTMDDVRKAMAELGKRIKEAKK